VVLSLRRSTILRSQTNEFTASSLSGRVALVTGRPSGLGTQFAKTLARGG
jgi:hypothetical protein